MTGVDASEEMTSEQLEAMTGGELLRNEVLFKLKINLSSMKYIYLTFDIGWLFWSSAKHQEIITASERCACQQRFSCYHMFVDGTAETLCCLSRDSR